MTEPDDLDRLLSPTAAAASLAFRARLADSTTRHIRRKVAIQKYVRMAALAASFAAGGLIVWFARPVPAERIVTVDRIVEVVKLPEAPKLPRSPHELELAAEQADGVEGARLFLDAGRMYGNQFNDWPAAMRCYSNAFDLDPTLVVKTDPTTDDWLLVKLKTDRRERDANP